MNKVKTLFLSIIISLAVAAIAFAWTNPTANPPGGGGALYYSGGNVGIGTTAPFGALHIDRRSNTPQIGLHLGNTGTYNEDTPHLTFGGHNYVRWGIVAKNVGAYGKKDLVFGQHNPDSWTGDVSDLSEVMRITNTGNVGIGTTEPSEKLTVQGKVRVESSSVEYRGISFWTTGAFSGTTCDTACGNSYCLGSYSDETTVTKIACSTTTPNKNCICIGRP